MHNNIHRIGAALVLVAALAGCGGGGGSGGGGFYPFPTGANTPAQTPPPDQPTAQADPYDQFIAYVQAMVATMLDTSEPANVAVFDPPPTSETQEPVAAQ